MKKGLMTTLTHMGSKIEMPGTSMPKVAPLYMNAAYCFDDAETLAAVGAGEKDGYLYGMFSFKEYGAGPLACVDIRTGEDKWGEKGFGPGQVILAGDKVIATSDKGEIVVVEASTNLLDWQPVATNTLTTGSAYFSDPKWTNFHGRFYRLRSP